MPEFRPDALNPRERESRWNQERLDYVLEATSDGIYDWDIPSGQVFFSPAYYTMLGYEPGAFPPTFESWRVHVHPEDLVGVEAAIARHFDPPYTPYSTQFRMRTQDGQWRWILSRGKVVSRDRDGRPLRMVGTHTDIHDRKLAEERYRLLFEHMNSGFAIHDAVFEDGRVVDYRIVEANPAYLRITNQSLESLVGRTLREVFPWMPEELFASIDRLVMEGNPYLDVHLAGDTGKWLESYCYRTGPGQFAVLLHDVSGRKEAELALQRSEAHYRLLAENSSDLITRHDLQGGYLWASPSALEMTGFTPEELVKQDSMANIHPEDRETLRQSMRRILETDASDTIQFRHRHADGHWRWVEAVARAVRDPESGEPLELQVNSRDIERARREARLMEESHALAHVGGWEYELLTGEIRWTVEGKRILGFDPAGPMPTLEQVRAYYTEESRTRIAEALENTLRTGEGWDLELDRIHPGGQRISVRINCKVELQDGKPVRLLGAVHDITEAKARRERERELEQFYRALLEVSGSLILVMDAGGAILHMNPTAERQLGWSLGEVQGRDVFDVLIPEPQRAEARTRALSFQVSDYPRQLEAAWITRSGERRWMALANSVILDAQGAIQYRVVTALDQTEKRRAEEQLRELAEVLEQRVAIRTAELVEANREMESFTYSISHDLRAPLRAVDGFSHMLYEDFSDILPPEGIRYLDQIRKGAQRMGDLIDDLLRFSRIGRTELVVSWVDMRSLLQDVLDEARISSLPDRVVLVVAELPPCQGDAGLLKQVWANLVSNALKFSAGRNPIRIEIGGQTESGAWTYWIRDNGVGFDMRYAQKLFHVFQRLHRQEDFEGTGIGLALCRHIVGRHGGQIRADGSPGEGACFTFSIPDRGVAP